MACEYYGVEIEDYDCDYDDERGEEYTIVEDGINGQVGQQKTNTVECRCGDLFEMPDEMCSR